MLFKKYFMWIRDGGTNIIMIHCPKDKMINPVSFSVYFACLYNYYRLAWCSQDVTCIAWHEGHSSHDPWLSYLVLYYYRLATHSHFILYWANLDPGIDTHPLILSCSLSLANRLVNIRHSDCCVTFFGQVICLICVQLCNNTYYK